METTSAPKKAKIRKNSQMDIVVQAYLSGITTTEGLAIKLQEACVSGIVVGLKKKTPEEFAKKDLKYYKKTVNWYLNQAKHKEHIDAPLKPRKKKELQETVAAAATTESAPATLNLGAETSAPVPAAEESFIPTI